MFVRLALLATLFAPAVAFAEEALLLVPHQGMLLDGDDKPVSGPARLKFALYELSAPPPNGGADPTVWTATFDVNVVRGLYAVSFGSQAEARLTTETFARGERWLGVTVDGAAELRPRLQIGTAPWAVHARVADRAELATKAESATKADTATLAETATRATSATKADTATVADTATLAGDATKLGGVAATGYALVNHTHDQYLRASDAGDLYQPKGEYLVKGAPASGATLTNLNPANFSSGTASIDISGNAATATTAGSFTGALAGDVTGPQGATSVVKIAGRTVTTATPATGDVLRWSGTAWAPTAGAQATSPFTPKSDLSPGAVVTSEAYTVTGTVAVSVVMQAPNGTIVLNGADTGKTWITAGPGDTLAMRVTSNSTGGGYVGAVLFVGAQSFAWVVRTQGCVGGSQLITASGTFTLPAGCVGPVRVIAIGGGAPGGTYPGSGGGSGYLRRGTYSVSGGISVTIGAQGQPTTFGSLLTAEKGNNGAGGDNSTGGTGGSSGGGKYGGFPGGAGGANGSRGGERNNETGNGATSQGTWDLSGMTRATLAAGAGGTSNFEGGGGGGGLVVNGSTVNGCNSQNTGVGGKGYGAGGGGGNGSCGAPGVVYVEWDL